MMRTLLVTSAAALVATAGALAANVDLDHDDDDVVTLEEFKQGRADVQLFRLFDRDDDGVITEEEVYAETFRQYDRDRDEQWQSEEVEEFMSAIRGADGISQ